MKDVGGIAAAIPAVTFHHILFLKHIAAVNTLIGNASIYLRHLLASFLHVKP